MQNENEYTDANGVRYVAQPEIAICLECAHRDDEAACKEAPTCFGSERKSGEWIIWVKAEKVSA